MSFKNIIGHARAVSFLKEVYRRGRLAHAYVFVGPAGIGKAMTARAFAALLLCSSPEEQEPCGTCASCQKVQAGGHPDLEWVVPDGSFVKIEAIREACRRLSLRGFESLTKVLVIDQANAMNAEASNALLKTLEEPSSHAVIILITDTLRSLLPTIGSRCQRVVFGPLDPETLFSVLTKTHKIGADEAHYLAYICQGSLGEALRYHASGLFSRRQEILESLMGVSGSWEDLAGDRSKDRDEKKDRMREIVIVANSWFRDVAAAKVSGEQATFFNNDQSGRILEASGRLSVADIEQKLTAIAGAASDAARHLNNRLVLAKLRAELCRSSLKSA